MDEVMTAFRVHVSNSQLLLGWDARTQGPLYYLWTKAWGLLFGTSEFSLRFWSVIWGTLTIQLVYVLTRQLFSGTGSILAALFFAVHPYAIYYSQEARPYALFLFLCVASYILLFSLMKQHRWPLALGFVLVTAAAFYTHVYGVFLILSLLIIYYMFRGSGKYRGAGRYPRPYLFTFFLIFLLCAPEAIQHVITLADKMAGPTEAAWMTTPSVMDVLKTPAKYFMNVRVGAIVLALVSILAILRFYSETRLRPAFKFLLILGISFWLIPWLISITVSPIFELRYTIPGLLIVICLMATASASLQALPRQLFVVVILGLTVYPLWNYYTKVDKDPWRQTGEYLSARLTSTDVVIPFPPFTDKAIKHYLLPHLREQVIRTDSVQALEPLLKNANRIWVVESYQANSPEYLAMIPLLRNTGHEVRSVNITSMQNLNPFAFWVCPIIISQRENFIVHDQFGPVRADSTITPSE
jgi:mannosyltransferase